MINKCNVFQHSNMNIEGSYVYCISGQDVFHLQLFE